MDSECAEKIEQLSSFQEGQLSIPPVHFYNLPAINPTKDVVEKTLDTFYPDRHSENKSVIKTKTVLGSLGSEMSSTELQAITTEVQCLVDTWLDSFEKELFEGKTLYELLGEME